ncbi:MAG: SPOR domain-containing protein [Comamonadaceae bacterium]|nr:SPOR domain-containing protein [Comamonadaceae bacterium]
MHYLRELANDFHTYYNAHQFLVDDAERARRAPHADPAACARWCATGSGCSACRRPRRCERDARAGQDAQPRLQARQAPHARRRPRLQRLGGARRRAWRSASRVALRVHPAPLPRGAGLGRSRSRPPAQRRPRRPRRRRSDRRAGSAAGPELDFYDMLPKQEVEVPEQVRRVRGAPAPPCRRATSRCRRARSSRSAEAEKLQAQLAQYGVDAKIQRFSLDDETWYRVRIGPIATVEELDAIRAKLAEAEVEATPVRCAGPGVLTTLLSRAAVVASAASSPRWSG